MSNNFNIYKSENNTKYLRNYACDDSDNSSFNSRSNKYNFRNNDEPGSKGSKGSKGEHGEQGETGSIGYRGLQGEQGIRGTEGPQGNNGVPGSIGLQGERGEKGTMGSDGIQGIKGEPGLGIKGPKGDLGNQGNQGIRGYKGEQGINGIKGEKGDDGIRGKPGEKGNTPDLANSIELSNINSNISNLFNINNNNITLIFDIDIIDYRGISLNSWVRAIKEENILKIYDKNNVNINCILRVKSKNFTTNSFNFVLDTIVSSEEIINKLKNVNNLIITTHNEFQQGPQGVRGESGSSIKGEKGEIGDVGPVGIGLRGPSSIILSDYWLLNTGIEDIPGLGTFTLNFFKGTKENYIIYLNKNSNSFTGTLNYEDKFKIVNIGNNIILEGPTNYGQISESYNRIIFKITNIIDLNSNYLKLDLILDKFLTKPNNFNLLSTNVYKISIGHIASEKGEQGQKGINGLAAEQTKPGTILGFSSYNSIDKFNYIISNTMSVILFENDTNHGNISNNPLRKVPFKVSCKIPPSKRLLIEFSIKLEGLFNEIEYSLSTSKNNHLPLKDSNGNDLYFRTDKFLTNLSDKKYIYFNPSFYVDYNINNISVNIGDTINFYLFIKISNGNSGNLSFGNNNIRAFSKILDLGILESGINFIPNLDDPNSQEFNSYIT